MQKTLTTFFPALPELAFMCGIFLFAALIVLRAAIGNNTNTRIPFSLKSYLTPRFFQTFLFLLSCFILFLLIYQRYSAEIIPAMRLIGDPNTRAATFAGLFMSDSFTHLVKIFLFSWIALFLLVTGVNREILFSPEGLLCMAVAILGSMFAISADDLLILFLGLEMQSCGIALFIKLDNKTIPEIPSKIFSVYSIGGGLCALGAAMLYTELGTTDYSWMLSNLLRNQPSFSNFAPYPLIAILFIMFGIFTKMLFIPFHGIFINTIEKSRVHVFAFLAFLPQLIGLSLIIRLFAMLNLGHFDNFLLGIGVIGMIVGYLNTLNQNQIKNMLACDALGNMGMLFVLFSASSLHAIPCIFFFFLVDAITFLVYLGTVRYIRSYGRLVTTLNDLCFIKYEMPVASLLFGVCILCFVGLPPFPGFLPFVVLIKTLILDQAYFSLLCICVFKVVAMVNGVRILNALFVQTPLIATQSAPLQPRRFLSGRFYTLIVLCIILLISMIYTDPILGVFEMAESALRHYSMQ